MILETTGSNTTICDVFSRLHEDEIIKGSVNCQTSVSATDSTGDGNSGANSTSNLDSGLGGGVIGGIVVGAVVLLSCIGLSIFFFFHRRHSQEKAHLASKIDISNLPPYAQLPASQHEEKAEMYVDPRDVAGDERTEALRGRATRREGRPARQDSKGDTWYSRSRGRYGYKYVQWSTREYLGCAEPRQSAGRARRQRKCELRC